MWKTDQSYVILTIFGAKGIMALRITRILAHHSFMIIKTF